MDVSGAILYAGLSFAAVVPLLAVWRRALLRWKFLDRPGARSSHTVPTPTGGGIAVVLVVVTVWLLHAVPRGEIAVVVIALALCLVSWIDDIRPLTAGLRLTIHAAAVLTALALLWPDLAPQITEWPISTWLWGAAVAIAWMWLINLYNFMDGIDGLAAIETVSIAIGVGVIAVLVGRPAEVLIPAAILAGAGLAFLIWNWHPAKLFLGDSGSVPLGFLLGWLLLRLVLEGAWLAALILPLYYLADATITLVRRIWRREPIWQAHRQHFYQLAVQRGLSHSQVATRIAACNVVLLATASASLRHPVAAAVIAVLAVAALLWHLGSGQGGTIRHIG